jgi:hypothetical protein
MVYLYFRFQVEPLPRIVVVPPAAEVLANGQATVRYLEPVPYSGNLP